METRFALTAPTVSGGASWRGEIQRGVANTKWVGVETENRSTVCASVARRGVGRYSPARQLKDIVRGDAGGRYWSRAPCTVAARLCQEGSGRMSSFDIFRPFLPPKGETYTWKPSPQISSPTRGHRRPASFHRLCSALRQPRGFLGCQKPRAWALVRARPGQEQRVGRGCDGCLELCEATQQKGAWGRGVYARVDRSSLSHGISGHPRGILM